MPSFDVEMLLAKAVVDRVEARNAKEAEERVLAGYGERVSGKRSRLRLLVVLGVERTEEAG